MRANTQLVVDGYPRSANSFAEAAFLYSQDFDLRMANHSHSAAQILRASERGVPCVVLLRQPEDAVASMMIMLATDDDNPEFVTSDLALDAAQADMHLRDYAAFYEPIEKHSQAFVTAEFSQVFKRFDELVEIVNRKYALHLSVPENDDDFAEGVAITRDEISQARVGLTPNYSAGLGEEQIAARKALNSKLIADIKERNSPALQAAQAVYRRMKAKAELA